MEFRQRHYILSLTYNKTKFLAQARYYFLSKIASIYDLLGLFVSVLLPKKLFTKNFFQFGLKILNGILYLTK